MKGVMIFGKKGKLNPRYVGHYKILKRIGKVAFELELPTELAAVHPVFHISLLKKCVGDPASIVPLESVVVKDSLSYEDVPVEILDHQLEVSLAFSAYLHVLGTQFNPQIIGQTTTRAGGPWFTTATPPQTQLKKLSRSRLTDRPMVCRSDHGPCSVFVDRGPVHPASDANDGRPTWTVIRSTVRRSDHM
ncbi:hypothetical protein MTR67_031399 [Solanum verrucosum]|uniref:Tf2-1-like SH3-like domain-containing protein n=1 Tax=Solanum verrucosum TaxID=315347 RepID=A0AAF0ZHJ7_SOLVR|nr:hypothetical protein MTR67_031399 [Solanum verrucosum]